MTPKQAKLVIDLIDGVLDRVADLVEIDTESSDYIFDNLHEAIHIVFDSFDGDEYHELNNLFDEDRRREYALECEVDDPFVCGQQSY